MPAFCSICSDFHAEKTAKACKYYLNQTNNQRIATKALNHLILLMLKMNTIIFCGRYFHQTKWTAIETPMTVNSGNCFMGRFETNLLQYYKKKIRKKPTLWLRFIYDVFIVWTESEAEFNHFIKLCNEYASSKGCKSKIKFTLSQASKAAVFVDTKIEVQSDAIYVQTFFVNQQHLSNIYNIILYITSFPKSQFMRIRQICSYIKIDNKHAT